MISFRSFPSREQEDVTIIEAELRSVAQIAIRNQEYQNIEGALQACRDKLRNNLRHRLYEPIREAARKAWQAVLASGAPGMDFAEFERLFAPLLDAGHELTDEPEKEGA